MRGVTVTNLLAYLKAEIGASTTVGTGMDTELTYLLANVQRWLAAEYDWSFLERRWDITVTSGTQYFAIPANSVYPASAATINWTRPVRAFTKHVEQWYPVRRGIGEAQYAIYDTENVDPILCYAQRDNAGTDMIEVWPLAATEQTLRLIGQKNVGALSAASDTCALDDLLLVYFAAAEYLARMDSKDASAKAARAQLHLRNLRAAYTTNSRRVVLGGGVARRVTLYIGPTQGLRTEDGSWLLTDPDGARILVDP